MFELLLPSIMTLKSHINICTPLQPFPCKQRMGTMEPPSWKSLRKRKHDDWSFAEVQACAAGMKDELPSQLRQIVEDPQYVGGTLIALINPPKVTWRDVNKPSVHQACGQTVPTQQPSSLAVRRHPACFASHVQLQALQYPR